MTIHVVGDSHVAAYRSGWLEMEDGEDRRPGLTFSWIHICGAMLSPFHGTDGGTVVLKSEEAAKKLCDGTGHAVFRRDVGVYALSMAFTTTVLIRHPQWRIYSPAGDGKRPLSQGVMAAIVRDHYRHILAFFADLAANGIPAVAVESPPPRADDPAVASGKVPYDRLLAVDRCARTLVKADLAALGIPVAEVPDEAKDRGFLKPSLCSTTERDYHHANADFGRLMIPRILAAAERAAHPMKG